MIYLDSGATSFHKPPQVYRAVLDAMYHCASPGRGGYAAAREAEERVFRCRELAGDLFGCESENVVFTASCTHGLNIAIRALVKPGARVVISGFEHNAVTRPLHALEADITVAGRKLFDWEDTVRSFRDALDRGAQAAVFTHVSNVFGYILPIREIAALCRQRNVPFILDAAQSAGVLPVNLQELGAAYIAMPGHKGLLGPQGTGLLLCGQVPQPLLFGGTGSNSRSFQMPEFLPDRLEPGTVNVPGIAGLGAGLDWLRREGIQSIYRREHSCLEQAVKLLTLAGMEVFAGEHQAGTVSFRPAMDCQEAARLLAREGIAVRSGLHCAPLAHESAGTLDTGTVRISFGFDCSSREIRALSRTLPKLGTLYS